MGAIRHFSTHAVAAGRKLEHWNACARAVFPDMTVDSALLPFEAELACWQAGAVLLARPRSQGSSVRRAGTPDGPADVIVHLQRRGRARQRQRASEQVLRPGDMSVCTVAEPLQLLTDRHEMLVVQAPRAPLELRLPGLDDRLCAVVDGHSPAVRMLHDFLLSLWREGEGVAGDAGWDATVGEVLFDLLALALRGDPPPGPAADARLDRLKRLVEARLGDPELTGAALAGELGLSLRRVQHLFASAATTPGAYILRRRLERAAEWLDHRPGASVTELAFDLGFNDSAYFSRCFRRRFGTSPSAWAARARGIASR